MFLYPSRIGSSQLIKRQNPFDIPFINTVVKFIMGGERIEVSKVVFDVAALEEFIGEIVWEFGCPHKGLVP